MVGIRDKVGLEPTLFVSDAKYTWFIVSYILKNVILKQKSMFCIYRMAVIGFICFVTVLGNFYQAIYDEIIYDNFGTGKEYSFHFHLCRKSR